MIKIIFAGLLICLPVLENGCRNPSEKKDIILPASCTSDSDCPEGYSCWHQLPKGPLPGVKGSKERPGKCYKTEAVKKVF